MPFDRIAPIVDRSPATAKKLASRARRRVHGAPTAPVADVARRRRVVETFLAAARAGDMATLLAVLDPDVVRRADAVALTELRGARAVAEETPAFAHHARHAEVALVGGTVGIVVAPEGRVALALLVTVSPPENGDLEGRITVVEVIAEPARLHRLDIAVLPA